MPRRKVYRQQPRLTDAQLRDPLPSESSINMSTQYFDEEKAAKNKIRVLKKKNLEFSRLINSAHLSNMSILLTPTDPMMTMIGDGGLSSTDWESLGFTKIDPSNSALPLSESDIIDLQAQFVDDINLREGEGITTIRNNFQSNGSTLET
ncbi:hypothetical protein MMC29_000990 [Sticta canariensis]|nr:hypothetical protein [Sticta canariensis]